MAAYENVTQLAIVSSTVFTNITRSTLLRKVPPGLGSSVTIPTGHAAILEMHANSRSNAIIYIGVVLLLYVIGMVIVLIKYFRTERYEARLTRLFQDLMQRDHFFRVSRRRSSVPKDLPETCLREELPHSSTFSLHENGHIIDFESKL